MSLRIAINGFGRMGRLALRAGWNDPALEFVKINEIDGSAETAAHLLNFDSIQGTWCHEAVAQNGDIFIEGKAISYTRHTKVEDMDLSGIDLVLECTGVRRTKASLQPYLEKGVKQVVVSCPVKDGPLNIVVGVNDHLVEAGKTEIVTAASCTTNCLAPVIKVIHEKLGIVHGSMTTIHDMTNTQVVLDRPHKDLRRARASSMSLIPTTTGSATAIGLIFPELNGKLNGVAIRVPLANASITDCVLEVSRDTNVEEVNALLRQAAEGSLRGVLGFETRPLVSIDYRGDVRSGVVDGPSTMVIDKRQVKLLVWYDNEWGYVNRMVELAKIVSGQV